MDTQLKVTVLGGGSFGTALANIVATNGHNTTLWMRNTQRAEQCAQAQENVFYLKGYPLHKHLRFSADLAASLKHCDIVVLSIPSQSFREVAKHIKPLLSPKSVVVSTTKGIETTSFSLMSEILEQELPDTNIGVLSGPNFAKEIIQGQYTASVVASQSPSVTRLVQQVFSSKTFRVYSNDDTYGVELSGALKNIYAIVAGMSAALGCQHNTQAMLITRSLAEMSRFAHALGANQKTFLGLAGVGDLILTCTSDLSRNYRLGLAVGQGKTLSDASAEIGQAIEGVNTLRIVKQKAKELDVYMPLVDGLHAVLFEQQEVQFVVENLMSGDASLDVE